MNLKLEQMEKSLRYNQNKPKWSMVHFKSLEPLVKVLEYGAHKYSIFTDGTNQYKGSEVTPEEVKELGLTLVSSGKDNWKIDLNEMEILESLSRHLFALMDGEQNDPESGLPHIGHIMCNTVFYDYHHNKNSKL